MPSRLASIVAAAAAIMLLTAAPALAGSAYYTVTGTGDDAESSCAGTAPDFTCPTLRAAVDAANLNPGYDAIFLDATGTYQLLRVLSLNDDVEIIGQGLRDTTLHGDGTDRVLTVAPGVSAGLYALTVANGYAADSDGGNILNRGSLWLDQVQVTRGRAGRGGGVYTVAPGDLEIYFGLVNDNTGGGIVNAGTSTANADFYSASSTFAFNTDGGIVSTGANSTVELVQVTLARNTGVGLSLESGQYSYLYGNILSDNSLGNCAAAQPPYDGGYNVENGTSCGLTGTGSLNADPRLDAQLSNAGGWSDVLTIPADSRAVDLVANCYYSIDQRGFERVTSYPAPCDAGAYEQSASGPTAPVITGGPSGTTPNPSPSFEFSSGDPSAQYQCQLSGPSGPGTYEPCTSPKSYSNLAPGTYTFSVRTVDQFGNPTGTPSSRTFTVASAPAQTPSPTPTPTPTPSPPPTPTPVPHVSVVVAPVSGKVLVRKPGSKDFVEIDATQGIPLGSTIDTKAGVIQLTAAGKGGKPETAKFYSGIFKITQSKATTDLTLNEPLAPCGKRAKTSAKKPKSRKLWGDGSGSFRTRGQYSSATVRGTQWLVQDSCAGTLTKVKKGVVSVRDNVKRKTILLKAGKQYLAKPRR